MVLFTHIINPYSTQQGSKEASVISLTYQGLRYAVKHARDVGVSVEVLGVCYEADAGSVRPPAKKAVKLTRTISDVEDVESKRALPLLEDVLDAGIVSGTGEYLVLSNMDIILQPYFYEILKKVVRVWPAATISRRTLDCDIDSVGTIEECYAEPGRPHEGFDAFVFPKAWVEKFDLDHICYGAATFDKVLIANMDAISGFRTQWFNRQFLTMHIGDDKAWRKDAYTHYNRYKAQAIYGRLIERYGYPPASSAFRYVYDRSRKIWKKKRLRRLSWTLDPLGIAGERKVYRWTMSARRRMGLNYKGFA